jgi:hypothetical protein
MWCQVIGNIKRNRRKFHGWFLAFGRYGIDGDAQALTLKAVDRKKVHDQPWRRYKIYTIEVESRSLCASGGPEACAVGDLKPSCPVLGERVHAFADAERNSHIP